jgi:Domain of unknown function (DUF4124)
MKVVQMVLACSLLMIGNAAWATVYEWTDSQGIVHLTDDADKVPAGYRGSVKKREVDPTGDLNVIPSAKDVVTPRETKDTLYGDHDATWWRTKFAAMRQELEGLQENLPEKKTELEKLHRQYVISLGRSPRPGETGESKFFKSPQEGKTDVTPEDTLTPNPLSGIGGKRIAYYDMLAQIKNDEARIVELTKELDDLESRANWFGVPQGWRH